MKTTLKITFIYALCEPGTRTVRYIGKANDPKKRLRQHLTKSVRAKTHLGCWLRSLAGETPNLVILREVPELQWEIAEERYIRLAKGCGMGLVNATDGGEGLNNPSSETRAKIGAANTGEKSGMFGKHHTPEARAKASASLKGKFRGEKGPFFGHTHTPEACAAISASHTGEKHYLFGKHNTPEVRAKMSASHMGVPKGPMSEAQKAAQSVSMKASWARRKERDQEIEWALAPYTLTD